MIDKLMQTIDTCLTTEHQDTTADADTCAEAWSALIALNEPKGSAVTVAKMGKLWDTHCREGTSISVHVRALKKIVRELRQAGRIVPDEDFCVILTCSLPASWNQWKSSFWGLHSLELTNSMEIQAILLLEEKQMNEEKPSKLAYNAQLTGNLDLPCYAQIVSNIIIHLLNAIS